MKKTPVEIILILLIVFPFAGCFSAADNNLTAAKFGDEFQSEIIEDSAKRFDYLYDGLVPQESYFVGNKLKYLKFRHGPEVGFVEGRVTFDLASDSIMKYILRRVLPGDDGNMYDSIFVFYPTRRTGEIYYNNKVIVRTYRRDIYSEQLNFIYRMKSATENAFISWQR